jgi:superfamily II DNA or RNA helicase
MKWVDLRTLAQMKERLTIPNPAYEKELQLVNRGIKKRFDHGIPAVLQLWEYAGDGARVPFGTLPARDGSATASQPWLRDYQRDAANACLDWDCGVVVAPCGAGKTQIGCGIIGALEADDALVIVHTKDLQDQWRDRLRALGFARVRALSGSAAFASDEWRTGPRGVVIATVQTLQRVDTRLWLPWGVVVVDEAHHAPASTFVDVLSTLPMQRVYGLTATPERADGMTPVMYAYLGPSRYVVDRDGLVDSGLSVVPAVVKVETGCYSMVTDYQGMVAEFARDAMRTAAILRRVQEHARWPQMCLTTLVEHAVAIEAEARARGLSVALVHGKTKGREAAIESVRAGEVQLIIATQLADEGLDIPALSAVHLCLPSRAAGRTEQRVGRIMRPSPEKGLPVIYDYVDDMTLCQRQWQARRKVYRSIGVAKWRVDARGVGFSD